MLSVALILYGSNSLSGFGTFSDFIMSYSVPLYVAVACQESAIRYRYIVGSASWIISSPLEVFCYFYILLHLLFTVSVSRQKHSNAANLILYLLPFYFYLFLISKLTRTELESNMCMYMRL
jgi:hypothetical protein